MNIEEFNLDSAKAIDVIIAFQEACKNLNLNEKKFSVKLLYEKLKEKNEIDADEELILTVLHHCRTTYEKIKIDIQERMGETYEQIYHLGNKNYGLKYCDWGGNSIEQWEYSIKKQYFNTHVGDDIIKGWRISTVWLGLNHEFFSQHDPLIFETMIFKDDQNLPDNVFCDQYQERYSTLEQAEKGHKQACDAIKNLEIILETIKQDE